MSRLESSSNALKVVENTVNDSQNQKRVYRHREERVMIPAEVKSFCDLVGDGAPVRMLIHDISTYGSRIHSTSKDIFLKINDVVTLNIVIAENTIFHGKARVLNEVESFSGLSYGISFEDAYIEKDLVRAIISDGEIRPKLNNVRQILEISKLIDPEFKILTSDLNVFFQDLKRSMNLEAERIKEQSISDGHAQRLEEYTISIATSLYGQELLAIFDRFQLVVDRLAPEQILTHKRYFRTQFWELVASTTFLKRAYEKPLGYAGDYGLMLMFYNYKDHGLTLFDRFMHRISCNQPAAIANKNRVSLLADMLEAIYSSSANEPFKASSIACGPARELELFLEQTQFRSGSTVHLNILDQEELALDHATDALRKAGLGKANVKVNALREDAVLGLIKGRPFVEDLRGSDVIISAGLFDYLSDRVATKLIESLYALLKPGGTLIIGNVSDKNPDKFSMDFFMEWNLVLRSQENLKSKVPDSIQNDSAIKVEIVSESLGLNLFLKIVKPK